MKENALSHLRRCCTAATHPSRSFHIRVYAASTSRSPADLSIMAPGYIASSHLRTSPSHASLFDQRCSDSQCGQSTCATTKGKLRNVSRSHSISVEISRPVSGHLVTITAMLIPLDLLLLPASLTNSPM